MLDALALHSLVNVQDGGTAKKGLMPETGREVLEYSGTKIVSGTYRRVMRAENVVSLPRTLLTYPPASWNVYSSTFDGGHRTNVHAAALNTRLGSTVDHSLPTVSKATNALRSVTMNMAHSQVGVPSKKRNESTVKAMQQRVHDQCEDYAAGMTKTEDFLRDTGHTIRF
ncbi:hypothetical protein HPB50_009868 [Hyalomma asiaticum]|uniref:Uncharacterized protein n=1 Tax=Hyalomma asiaticum TaxID=266040 RepID=A0ACB7SFG3_HYAAI|nr:hypothetical protein HPB50_009868 [Hyalomma asiaticum]